MLLKKAWLHLIINKLAEGCFQFSKFISHQPKKISQPWKIFFTQLTIHKTKIRSVNWWQAKCVANCVARHALFKCKPLCRCKSFNWWKMWNEWTTTRWSRLKPFNEQVWSVHFCDKDIESGKALLRLSIKRTISVRTFFHKNH